MNELEVIYEWLDATSIYWNITIYRDRKVDLFRRINNNADAKTTRYDSIFDMCQKLGIDFRCLNNE